MTPLLQLTDPLQQAHVADEAEEDVPDAAEEDVSDAAEAAVVHAAAEGALHDAPQEVLLRGRGGLRLGQGDLHRQRGGRVAQPGANLYDTRIGCMGLAD